MRRIVSSCVSYSFLLIGCNNGLAFAEVVAARTVSLFSAMIGLTSHHLLHISFHSQTPTGLPDDASKEVSIADNIET